MPLDAPWAQRRAGGAEAARPGHPAPSFPLLPAPPHLLPHKTLNHFSKGWPSRRLLPRAPSTSAREPRAPRCRRRCGGPSLTAFASPPQPPRGCHGAQVQPGRDPPFFSSLTNQLIPPRKTAGAAVRAGASHRAPLPGLRAPSPPRGLPESAAFSCPRWAPGSPAQLP